MQKLSLDEATSSTSVTPADAVGPTATTDQRDQTPAWSTQTTRLDGSNGFGQNRTVSATGKSSMRRPSSAILVVMLILAVGAGVATGYGGYKLRSKTTGSVASTGGQPIQQVAGDSVKAGQVFGVQDEKTFKDSAEGFLEDGGIGGEGSHKLLRAGGASQTVVLTSSVTDLSKFVGMQVKVWGETFKAQKAGWLMDVGRVQVVDVNGKAPAEGE